MAEENRNALDIVLNVIDNNNNNNNNNLTNNNMYNEIEMKKIEIKIDQMDNSNDNNTNNTETITVTSTTDNNKSNDIKSNENEEIKKADTMDILNNKLIGLNFPPLEKRSGGGGGSLPLEYDDTGFIKRTHSLDSGFEHLQAKEDNDNKDSIKDVRQMTFEIMTTKDASGKIITEELTVPARDVLKSYPFYSTPLTNNSIAYFLKTLRIMGYQEQAEAALVHTNAESVEAAIDFILNNVDSLWHRFVPPSEQPATNTRNEANVTSNDTKNTLLEAPILQDVLCAACGMKYSEHLIDHHGEKIARPDPGTLPGDLGGRMSMSVATKQQRDELHKQLQDMVKNRLKMVPEEIKPTTSLITELVTADKGPTLLCKICFDEKPTSAFYEAPCGHNYCTACLEQHYKIKARDGDVLKISCIDVKCGREIPETEFKKFLTDPEILQKYERFRRQRLIMLNANARFCPKPDCEGYMIGSRWRPRLVCPKCKTETCFNCSQQWHGYFIGCNQNVELGYMKWALNKDIQKCPKCHMIIEKEEGCNHMTCQYCRHEFCWICRGQYTSHHFDPWNIFGCPGAQYTPHFCRFPAFFPHWLNRILVIICFLGIIVPLALASGILWLTVVILVFCIRCDASCDIDPCDCFD